MPGRTLITLIPLLWISLCVIIRYSNAHCQNDFNSSLQFLKEYASWRKINFFVVIDEHLKTGCHLEVMKSLAAQNISVSLHTTGKDIDKVLQKFRYRSGVVTFWNSDFKELTEQADTITQYGSSWLIIAPSKQTKIPDGFLRYSHFGLDSDIVIAIILNATVTNISNGNITQNSNKTITESSDLPKCSMPYQENDNCSLNVAGSFCHQRGITFGIKEAFCLVQIYKIRKSLNSSVVICPLGIFDSINGSKHLQPFLEIEKRLNFQGLPLIFGTKEGSKGSTSDDISADDDADNSNTNEFLTYFTMILNASKTFVNFPKIGTRDSTGEWSDLLGAVVKEDIDITSSGLSKTVERCDDMSFTQDILKTTKNIYIQPKESNELRDIFLVPFDSRLVLCVLGTGLIFSLVMSISNKISSQYYTNNVQIHNGGFLDSLVWCIGIFSQQGSIWKPTVYGGQILVLVSLAFTLLIYNSYSAFITSVLSVELNSIRNVDDLLESDYQIGYTKNSYDEVYLRSMNMSQLNQIYLRGYLQNDVSNVSEGLLKATKGNYGFFASSQLARKQLLNISNYKCMFDIDEIPIKYTVDHLAFVMGKRSPYKKLINLSIIKMYETGIYKYIYALIHPSLLKCEKRKTYQSARLTDLLSAFLILILGLIMGVVFLVAECLWKKRKGIVSYVKIKVAHGKFVDVQNVA